MTLMTAKEVKARCGGVTDMTIWRWLQDPETGFPAPRYVRKRRYWRADELDAWLNAERA
jgi:predicted DNA-binding transcriptional regulator AlpA